MKGGKLLAHHSNEYDDQGAFLTFTSSHPAGHEAAQKERNSFLLFFTIPDTWIQGQRKRKPYFLKGFLPVFEKLMIISSILNHLWH